jgi:hypothetical protein
MRIIGGCLFEAYNWNNRRRKQAQKDRYDLTPGKFLPGKLLKGGIPALRHFLTGPLQDPKSGAGQVSISSTKLSFKDSPV